MDPPEHPRRHERIADENRPQRGCRQRQPVGRQGGVEVAAAGLVDVHANAEPVAGLGEPPGVGLVHGHERGDVQPLVGLEDRRVRGPRVPSAGRST